MSKTQAVCPYCGKEMSNPEKLARHLSRECPRLDAAARAEHDEAEQQPVARTERRR